MSCNGFSEQSAPICTKSTTTPARLQQVLPAILTKVQRPLPAVGAYRQVDARRDTEELAGIYAELDRIEPVKQEGQRVRPRIERYYWPLAAALLVALLAFLIPRRRS